METPQDSAREQGAPGVNEIAQAGTQYAMSNYSQKVIEKKEQELRDLVMLNYNRIRGVERELAQLQLQLRLTAGPKKAAMELMRRKIEEQNERVVLVRDRHTVAKKIFVALEEELKKEEEVKEHLCTDLNTLIQQSAAQQMNKMEELRQQLELLNGGLMMSPAQPSPLPPPMSASEQEKVVVGPATLSPLVSAPSPVASDDALLPGPGDGRATADASHQNGNTRAAGAAAAAAVASVSGGGAGGEAHRLAPSGAARDGQLAGGVDTTASAAARSRHVPLSNGGRPKQPAGAEAISSSEQRAERPARPLVSARAGHTASGRGPAPSAVPLSLPNAVFSGFDT